VSGYLKAACICFNAGKRVSLKPNVEKAFLLYVNRDMSYGIESDGTGLLFYKLKSLYKQWQGGRLSGCYYFDL
jgi:hypothetical protein